MHAWVLLTGIFIPGCCRFILNLASPKLNEAYMKLYDGSSERAIMTVLPF